MNAFLDKNFYVAKIRRLHDLLRSTVDMYMQLQAPSGKMFGYHYITSAFSGCSIYLKLKRSAFIMLSVHLHQIKFTSILQ